ncbi:MAG: glycosyltransferase, partial [Clostridia bacterium]|nr:glycosyltransferase [Clostridia bacterium]
MSVYKNEDPKHFIDSLESILNQTIKPSEIVLVRDGQVPKELQEIIDRYVNTYDFFNYIPLEEN